VGILRIKVADGSSDGEGLAPSVGLMKVAGKRRPDRCVVSIGGSPSMDCLDCVRMAINCFGASLTTQSINETDTLHAWHTLTNTQILDRCL
jgi:hypothetical protein